MVLVPRSSFVGAFSRMATADKFVNNRLVNVLGCQPVRTLVAAALVRWRRLHVPGVADIGRRLLRDGVVVMPDYFETPTFEALRTEVEQGFAALAKTPPAPDKFGIVRQQVTLHKYPERFPLVHNALL